jgi:hypothetical protein
MVKKKTKRKINKKGKGLFKNIKALIYGRKELPPKVRNILKKHGDVEIAYIKKWKKCLN